jgi:ribosome-associated translation inhibitor RaiA
MDLSGLTVFVKYGSELFFGTLPAKVTAMLQASGEEVDDALRLSVSKQIVPPAAAADMNAQIDDAFDQLSTDLVKLYKQYKSLDAKLEKEKLVNGSLSEAKQTELDNAKRIYERILSTVTSLADCLAKEAPVLEVGSSSVLHRSLLAHFNLFVISIAGGGKGCREHGYFFVWRSDNAAGLWSLWRCRVQSVL